MAKTKQALAARRTRQDSDYDGAWKEFLRRYLRLVLALYFPKLHKLIDWSFEPEWLDKEIGQILAKHGRRNGRVDLLFKVRLLDGESRWILFHLDVQSSRDDDFEFRMACYNAGILWAFRQRVVTLAILADLDENWMPSEDTFTLDGFEAKLKFPVCKLIDRLPEWEGNNSLPAVLARAQIAALQTAGDPEARYAAKRELVRGLYSAGYSKEELREAFRLIDWMMKLQQRLNDRFNEEIKKYEEEIEMPFVPSFERSALSKGRREGRKAGIEQGLQQGVQQGLQQGVQQGLQQGVLETVMRGLNRRLADLATTDCERIQRLTLEQLQELSVALFDFESHKDLHDWLQKTAK